MDATPAEAAARADDIAAVATVIRYELLAIDRMFGQQSYAAGEQPTAADFVLYPGLATKLLSHFTNALAHTDLNEPVKPFAWVHPADRIAQPSQKA